MYSIKMYQINLNLIVLFLVVGCLCGALSKECYSCKGINCLRTSKVTNKITCVDALDSCVTVFERLTVIVRGCYSTLPIEHRKKCDNVTDTGCHKCYKSLCNDIGATSCLRCSFEDNKDCYSGVSRIEPTPCYVSTAPNTYCYTRKSSDKIERGCLIDTNEQLKCLGDSSCEMCIADGDDTCNRDSVDNIESGSERVTVYSILLLAMSYIPMLL